MLNIEGLREDTPSSRIEINLNHATRSPTPMSVVEEMCRYLRERITNDPWLREAWAKRMSAIKPSIAQLVNASADEIVLTRNASEALNIVAHGVSFEKGDNVVISNLEFHSNVTPWMRLVERKGIELRIAKAGNDLVLDPGTVEDLVNERTKLISIVHVVNSIGTVQPVEEIGRIAKEHGSLFMVNGSMSCGGMPVDVKRIGCDFLLAPGRKWLRAPDGCGFLYINAKAVERVTPPFIGYRATYWLPDENKYEYLPGAGRYEIGDYGSVNHLGLGLAVDYALNLGIEEIEKRIRGLFSLAYDGLSEMPDVEIYGTSDMSRRMFLAMNIKGMNPWLVSSLMQNRRIVMESGDYLNLMIPNVIGAEEWLRVSPHYFNTEQEIERFVNAAREIARRFKGTTVPKYLGYTELEKNAVR